MMTRLDTQEAQSITWEYKVVAKKFQMKDKEGGGEWLVFAMPNFGYQVDILEPRYDMTREDKGSKAISSRKPVSGVF